MNKERQIKTAMKGTTHQFRVAKNLAYKTVLFMMQSNWSPHILLRTHRMVQPFERELAFTYHVSWDSLLLSGKGSICYVGDPGSILGWKDTLQKE